VHPKHSPGVLEMFGYFTEDAGGNCVEPREIDRKPAQHGRGENRVETRAPRGFFSNDPRQSEASAIA